MSNCHDKTLDKSKVYFDSQFGGTVCHGRRVRQQEPEVAAHVASTVRKQRDRNAVVQLASSSDAILGPAHRDGTAHILR